MQFKLTICDSPKQRLVPVLAVCALILAVWFAIAAWNSWFHFRGMSIREISPQGDLYAVRQSKLYLLSPDGNLSIPISSVTSLPSQVLVSPISGQILITDRDTGTVTVRSLMEGGDSFSIRAHSLVIEASAWCHLSEDFCTVGTDAEGDSWYTGHVRYWSKTGDLVGEAHTNTKPLSIVCESDGMSVLTGTSDGRVCRYSLPDLTLRDDYIIGPSNLPILCVACSRGKKWIAGISSEGVHGVNMSSNAVCNVRFPENVRPWCMQFSSVVDGRIVVGASDGVYLVSLATGATGTVKQLAQTTRPVWICRPVKGDRIAITDGNRIWLFVDQQEAVVELDRFRGIQ